MPSLSHQSSQKQEKPSGAQQSEHQSAQAAPSSPLLAQRVYADPGSLNPTDVLALQRTMGNRAIAQMLGRDKPAPTQPAPLIQTKSQPMVGAANDKVEQEAEAVAAGVMENSSTQPYIQRNEESAKTLTDLAKPKVFPGPDIGLQKGIVEALEEEIRKGENPEWDKDILYVGSIELSGALGKGFEDVVSQAKMVNSEDNAIVPQQGMGKGMFDGYGLVEKAGQQKNLILNTLKTMAEAGQLDYLQQSKLIGDEWKIVIEIHYYRKRSKQGHNFHKDTLGQTLFVNLNYNTDEEIAGPEFIINPPAVEKHDIQLGTTLPPVFLSDLETVRKQLPEPEMIETATVPVYGVVAFVDEAIHHMTPMVGHRTLTGMDIGTALTQINKDDWERAKKAHDRYNSRWFNYKYEDYLDKDMKSTADMWYALVEMTKTVEKARYTRNDLEKAGVPELLINEILRTAGNFGFRHVSIPDRKVMGMDKPNKGYTISSEIEKNRKKKALTRRMSILAKQDKLPSMGKEDRSFFRTWVRAVRQEQG